MYIHQIWCMYTIKRKCETASKARLEEAYAVGVDYLLMELKRENCNFLVPIEAL